MQQIPQEEGFRARLGTIGTPPPWSLGDVGLVLVVLALGLFIIASTVTILIGNNNPTPSALTTIIGWMVGLGLAGAFVIIRWRRNPDYWAHLNLKPARLPDALAFLMGVAVAFTADLLAAGGSGQFSVGATLIGLSSGIVGEVAIGAIFVMLIQPLVEGLIFFGIILPRLRAQWGGYGGWLLSALIYMAYYGLIYGARFVGGLNLWYGFIYALLIALVIGAMRIQTQSTRSAIAGLLGVGFSAVMVLLAIG